MTLRFKPFAAVTIVLLCGTLAAQMPIAPPGGPAAKPAEAPSSAPAAEPGAGTIRPAQAANLELFRKFQRELFTLAQRLDASDKPEDKERAKVIFKALEHAKEQNLEKQFADLVTGLETGGVNPLKLGELGGRDAQLTKALQDMMAILMADDSSAAAKAEIERLEAALKAVNELLRNQKSIRARTESERADAERIAADQRDLAARTAELAKKMGGDPKDPKNQTGAISKSEPKTGAKDGESGGEAKPETGESKAEPKPAPAEKPDGGEKPKPGSDAKPGTEAAGEPKPSSESKPGDGAGEPKAGPPKTGEEPKGAEPKPGPMDPAGKPEAKPAKPGEAAESKAAGQGKGQDKPADGKGGEGKPSQPKDAPPSAGSPPPSASKGGGTPPPGGQQPPQSAQQPPQMPGRKQVQEAYPHQKGAEADLNKKDRTEATKQEEAAIKKLAEAAKELEKRLKQLREEEMLKLLANLEARCNRILALQIEVYEATKVIDGQILKNAGVKSNADVQKSQQQSDKERDIVAESERTLKLLESEGTAVAFARIFEEVRQDMVAVQNRLNETYVGRDTQAIEENIIAMLKEMVAALKKAQQDQKDQQANPSPSQASKPPNQALIELLAELKLIRSLQEQLNGRTRTQSEQYKGEQASEAIHRAELSQLSQRQAKLQDMLAQITAGKNQ